MARWMETTEASWVLAERLAFRAPSLHAAGAFAALLLLVLLRPWAMLVSTEQAVSSVTLRDEIKLHGNGSVNEWMWVVGTEAFLADTAIIFKLRLRARVARMCGSSVVQLWCAELSIWACAAR